MTNSLSLQTQLVEIDSLLTQFLTNVECSFAHFNQSSTEAYLQFKERFAEKIREWQAILDRAHCFIVELPKDIQHRDVVSGLRRDLTACQYRVKDYLTHLPTKADLWTGHVKTFMSEVGIISRRVAELQSHPAIERFAQGKQVLACHTQFQWGRKLLHTGMGMFGFWLYTFSGLSEPTVITILVTCLAGALSTEIVRYYFPRINDKICVTFAPIMRERERTAISSSTWYMISTLLVFLVFPKLTGSIVLLFVALGDTAAGIVGVKWGRHRLAAKVSLEGVLAGFAVCAASTYLLMRYGQTVVPLSGTALAVFSVLAGAIGAGAETVLKKWDDNLVIPLVSAPCIWVLVQLFTFIAS